MEVWRSIVRAVLAQALEQGGAVEIQTEEFAIANPPRVLRKEKFRAPAAGPGRDALDRREEVFRLRWTKGGHSTTVESLTACASVRHLWRSSEMGDQRLSLGIDEQGAVGSFTKRMSSARRSLRLCRRVAAMTTACGIRAVPRFIESERDHADGPRRRQKLGFYSGPNSVRWRWPQGLDF